jgi:DNA-directed RNA polymerase subunit alpha
MSNNIYTANIVNVNEHSDQSATFIIEPLHSGYGNTLGNSLRRVLLSSISGAAVTSFKIQGIGHEFTDIPGVVEDVIDIMQNIKGIRFRVYGEEKHTVRLTKKGKGPVTAKDIESNADVEVVNPEHFLATIDNDQTQLIIDFNVEIGRGYRTIEESTDKKPSDTIALDAVFSPVLRVRYKIENTRVGQATDLDKLLLTIDTDGTITPRDAFEEAAAILINQYTSLAGKTRVEMKQEEDELIDSSTEEENVDQSEDSVLNTSIEDLNLSARTTNALINNEIHTIKDLFSLNDAELKDLKGFGSRALDEVKETLSKLEL